MANWLSSLDFGKEQKETFSKCAEGTGQWLLETQKFKDWLSGKQRVLWCPGDRELISLIHIDSLTFFCEAGVGKTVLV